LIIQRRDAILSPARWICVTKKTKESTMSVAKNSEITAASSKSFEDAVRKGISKMAETVKNIEGAWVKEQKVVVK
jgi:flavin-binding protein dodecin